MTVKEQLHRMIEQLSEEDAGRMLDSMRGANGGNNPVTSSPPIGDIKDT